MCEKLTIAHIIPRSKSKLLYYYLPNLIVLNVASHSFIDHNQHPISGESINKLEKINIWKWIVGENHYNWLLTILERGYMLEEEKNKVW